jgi:uncharacterized Zn finger protein
MFDAVDGRCPKCGGTDDVTSVELVSQGHPTVVASRCWGCGYLWTAKAESPTNIEESSQSVLTITPTTVP